MTSEPQPALPDAIDKRQREILRGSLCCSGVLLLLWVPIFFLVQPGTSIRPMVQLPCSIFLVLPITVVNVFKGLKQLRVTWPKRQGIVALGVSLVPFILYLILQWILLGFMGITYGE